MQLLQQAFPSFCCKFTFKDKTWVTHESKTILHPVRCVNWKKKGLRNAKIFAQHLNKFGEKKSAFFAVQTEKCEWIYSRVDNRKWTMKTSHMFARNVKIHWQLFQRVCCFIAWILYVHLLFAVLVGRSSSWEMKVEGGWVTADNARLIIEQQLLAKHPFGKVSQPLCTASSNKNACNP